ncbi:hypothetical protein J3486_00900 [Streptomyces sp. VRA16 Mangrove soil]|nr:hypothetical protein [Streptomyces sp. VRA16 Mangrove soil]
MGQGQKPYVTAPIGQRKAPRESETMPRGDHGPRLLEQRGPTIVGVAPFSTDGAPVLSHVQGVDRRVFHRRLIGDTCGIVAAGPVVAWGAVALPRS